MIAPARRILEEAAVRNEGLGHDNLGSLSYSHGFLPRTEPRRELPKSHRAWDEIADMLPALYRDYAVRRVIGEMPILSAKEGDLPELDVLRASSLLSILAHLYWYAEPEAPEAGIPPQIQKPWEEITVRLARPAPHLSFIDLNSHNWRFIDPALPQPFVVENLRLAIPLVGNEEERRFQTTPIEMLYLFAPMIEPLLAAQEAVLRDEPEKLKQALVAIGDALHYTTYTSLQKVNPNPYSDQYINPVVWGKTTAPFASPFQKESIPGPSGTAIPSFTSLDIFFGRKRYQTTVGHETHRTRDWFPRHWREWLDALEAVSVTDYVAQRGDRELSGIYEEARGAYAGDSGLLSRHRLKAYGFLDLSFKAGRLKTLGGVSGSYSERVWDRMATELNSSRLERYGSLPETTHFVPMKRVEALHDPVQDSTRRIVFDIAGTGIRYQPGDRCGVLPENSDELVDKTLRALHARGNEPIQLNPAWRWHVNLRDGHRGATDLPLATLLRFGRIRPLDRSVALALHAATNNQRLQQILDGWAEDQWELWDILALLEEGGYHPRRPWKATPGDPEHICRIVPPESWRLYSISSAMSDAAELELTVGGLRYRTTEGAVTRGETRSGTGSRFLASLGEAPSRTVSIKIVHPPRFSLPADASRPIVMFAGGTGIAPMRGLLAERMRQAGAGANWLFFGTRDRNALHYRAELESCLAEGKLELRVAFSRDDVAARFDRQEGRLDLVPAGCRRLDEEILDPDNARLLWDLLRSTKDGGQGAYFFLCGRTAFASAILAAVQKVLARHCEGATDGERDARGRAMLYRLMGEDRFMQEIFTTYEGARHERPRKLDVSEVVLHNDDEHGYWIIVSGRVYDMTEFNHIHPGGAKIIQSYSGMDATIAYQKVEHHINPEIDAMLGMYLLGTVRTPELGQAWGVALSKTGLRPVTLRSAWHAWVDLLYMVVEIENAVANDLRIREEPLTEGERADRLWLSPAKVREITATHERLVTGYLDHLLGEPMQTLWALTVGIVGQGDADARWMERRLAELRAETTAQAVTDFARQLRERLKQASERIAPEEGESRYGGACTLIAREDRRLLGELKSALRDGVVVFEELGPATLREGGARLLAALERVPTVVASFYARVAAGLE